MGNLTILATNSSWNSLYFESPWTPVSSCCSSSGFWVAVVSISTRLIFLLGLTDLDNFCTNYWHNFYEEFCYSTLLLCSKFFSKSYSFFAGCACRYSRRPRRRTLRCSLYNFELRNFPIFVMFSVFFFLHLLS